ncbi:MAG: hypothetical protein HYU36_22595 [Planctomycetes bacterium]|nr:hypothetical protein [Planctomycetota bacterium]
MAAVVAVDIVGLIVVFDRGGTLQSPEKSGSQETAATRKSGSQETAATRKSGSQETAATRKSGSQETAATARPSSTDKVDAIAGAFRAAEKYAAEHPDEF